MQNEDKMATKSKEGNFSEATLIKKNTGKKIWRQITEKGNKV